MNITAYRDEIKLKLTGGLLEIELTDDIIDKLINSALREVQRYICSTRIVTIPYSKCIKMSEQTDKDGNNLKVSSVSRIYRSTGLTSEDTQGTSAVDPMYAAQWQLLSGTGNMYNFQDYAYNYAAYNTLLQVRNTTSTDLAFRYDKASDCLYINNASNTPSTITVEYVPRFDSVEEIVSDYWIDVLIRMSVALAKVTVGRIRTRYTQSNALWQQDGQQMLDEGTNELNALRESMQANSQLCYPID